MDKNEDFTALPKPKSDLNPDRKNFVNTNAATSSNMNGNDSPVDPSPPFRNEGKKRKNIFIPTSFDSNIISVLNDRSTSNLEEPTVQNKGKSKIITKEQDHIAHDSNKRVTNKESIKERYLIETETVPIQTESKFKYELEGEQQCAKKVKLANGFGEEGQLTKTTTVSIQPKSKGLRMREHDQPRQAVKKAKIANDPEGSGNHHGSTLQTISQNNNNRSDIQYDSIDSSSTQNKSLLVESFKKGFAMIKNFVMSEAPDDKTVQVIFHVHLPMNFRSENLVIVGSIEELGNWEESKVKIIQYINDNSEYTSYWYSEPIRIPIERFQSNAVEYKYAVLSSDNRLQFEGDGPKDNRVLEITRQKFDIWKNNSINSIKQITDYMFLDVIYESVTLKNIKEMILDYDYILKKYRKFTLSVTNIQFIIKRASENSVDKQLFLCFLLGHCSNTRGRLEFPKNFQSAPLLQAFFKVQSDTFPSDSWRIVLKGMNHLIHQDIKNGSFIWLKIFTIARIIDPQYKFVETIIFGKCDDDKYIEACFKYILKLKFDESTRAKIIKWLMSQCKTMKILSIVWKSSDKTDEQYLVEMSKKIISKDDPVVLHNTFTELPDDIRDIVTNLFRKRALQLLANARNTTWNDSQSKSMFYLLNSVRLHWTKDEYIVFLETVSTLDNYQLLSEFPSFLKYWIQTNKNIDNKIAQICIQWYKKFIDRTDHTIVHRGEYVFAVFEKLSYTCSVVKEQFIFDELMKITFNCIRQSSEQSIFNVTNKVVKFGSEAERVFTQVIYEKIDSMNLDYDERLLKKMQGICGYTGKSLEIPNEFCEKILFHIMSCLQKKSSNASLLESAKFWIIILRATGSTQKFHSHQLVQETKKTIFDLANMINYGSININHLQDLLKLNDDDLNYYLNSANIRNKVITKEKLVKVRQNCRSYEQRLKILGNFYKRFCPLQKIKDAQDYLNELVKRSKKLGTISLKEALSEDHWNFHNEIISIAENTHALNKSHIFYNVFEKLLNEEYIKKREYGETINVEYIAKTLMKNVLSKYIARCKQYIKWEDLKYSEEIPFWCNVSNFHDELRLMETYGNIQIRQSRVFMITIEFLSKNKDWEERIKNLSNIIKIFDVKENWLKDLINHEELGKLSDSFITIDKYFSTFNYNSWAFIKELSRSKEFIEFLSDKTDDDLKNLINGVDEHSDTRLIQEGTISSLIQVKQFLQQFMNNSNLTLDTFLKEFNDVQNPSLASKLSLCNSNFMVLKNMYESIYNKGEVTKEKIQNAANIGTYEFVKKKDNEDCNLSLTYTYRSEVMRYNINELQDLRSRALLISKPGVYFGQDDDDIVKDNMDEFVKQVDISQSIIITMKKLTQLGHFGYRKYHKSAKGTNNLEEISIKLRNDLEIWEEIVNRIQENCYYLNFYPERHILAFYDYYTSKSEQVEITDTCQTLVSFVNRKVKLSQLKGRELVNCKYDKYDQVLEEINDRLESTFGTLQKHARPVTNWKERVISDTVERGELFIAACNDQSKVPNIIMSFYVNHGVYPEPWQLLICMTSTTKEELSIFIKRCFFASKNGYRDHLFCIVNLELLDFELQYYLVNKIRFFMERVDDYYLALICCSETGMHHHILDQFSKNVHATDGIGAVAMKAIYRELCQNVMCVTSALSGQGKTQFIKQKSYENDKNLVPFLISDGASYNSLIRQLQNSHIQQVDNLHINIISTDNPREVNMFLFQILTLGIISNNVYVTSLPDTNIFIEIASVRLLESLPFINCFKNTHLVWDINSLNVSENIHSPIQVVCRYLDLYDKKRLDKENIFFRSCDCIDRKSCRKLLDKYFFRMIDPNILSFRFLEIFLNFLADQLKRLSESSFFTVSNLKFMTNDINIRSTLFNILLDVSKEFSTKSTNTKSAKLQAISNKAKAEVDQLENLVQWDDSNHLLVFFMSQSPESICALYRDVKVVPNNVLGLLESQRWELVDYQTLPSELLLSILECLARKKMHEIKYQPYALTAENLLKMALMLLRTRANIPVVICGEAGCGKTSLISFLAKVAEVEFDALNLHAGVTEKEIKDFMNKSGKKAKTSEIWLFFDEINTCNHIGLLADLIAHRMFDGKQIHQNIRLFAACNPYRVRKKSVSNVGLKPKKIIFNQRNALVYEVKPLPDQILDYVWDYGILQSKDEKIYIQIMVQKAKLDPDFANLLFASQEFIRNVEESYSVSLRDVKRAIKLFEFFYKSLQIRQSEKKNYPGNSPFDIVIRSYVLALGLCYQSRLYEHELRRKYRETICKIFRNMNESDFNDIIRAEQRDYMRRMTCPPNTAFNEALLENVLAVIVCIMCKIPLFIVGSPGSSKSLAIRLVHQNLKGSDSNDAYFRTLPYIFFIPHQGSSSSTSDGIEKVFQKAKAYQETSSKEFPVISVVLLDEVGLAETSPYNPLKVLHSLLEPSYPADGPTVSVIGISNWRLDNSKSSRALMVQRPNFDLDDLIETAARLLVSEIDHNEASLKLLAEAYSEYETSGQEVFPNFHGLRDYYALIKSLSNKVLNPKNIYSALTRNFGGIQKHTENCLNCFSPYIKILNDHKSWTYDPINIDTLINENLESKGSRHLMVIGKSDSIVNILAYQLHNKNLDPIIILGSQFPEDRDDYSYNILSKIMMCVEAGRPLILTDLESIYGSLYDLWNQNYITMGSSDNPKYFTRVALGAYANPMLHIHPDFRCILVLDEKKLNNADPPLLNRFEKQRMTINDILDKNEKELVNQLREWTRQMVTVTRTAGTSYHNFTIEELFIGFNGEETLQSLIIDTKKKEPRISDEEILAKCKENLISIATTDGLIRIEKSTLDFEEIQYWKNLYFQDQHHDDIADYFQDLLRGQIVDANGHLVIINTFSNINADVESCLSGITSCYVLKLSTFKTESQFQKQVSRFWFKLEHENHDELLILQCDISIVNSECIKLAKFIIEQCRNEYLQKQQENKARKIKHACIILHLHRENYANITSFNFMSGWKQITIESLTEQEKPLSTLLERNICDIIKTTYPFEDILKQELLWCLLCMKYPDNVKSINHVKYLRESIIKHPNFVNCLKIRTLEWLKTNTKPDWQYHVASDKKLLYPHSLFAMALQAYIRTIVRDLIAKILYSLERLGATKTFLVHDMLESQMTPQSEQLLKFWKDMFMDNNVINFDSLPDPMPDRYTMPVNLFELQFPFSFYFMKQIDSFKTLYEEEMSILGRDTKNLSHDDYEDYIQDFSKKIFKSMILLDSSPLEDASDLYFNDFVNVIFSSVTTDKNISVLSYIFQCKLGKENITNPILLHIFWWKSANSTLAAFRLIHECPLMLNEIIMNYDELAYEDNLEQQIVDEATSLMLIKLGNGQGLVELQLEIRNVLNLCEKLSNFKKTESFQFLQICNNLLSVESIPLKIVKKMIETKVGEELFSKMHIRRIFKILNNIKGNESDKILFAKQYFITKSLEIIPFDSPSRLELYHTLFLENPSLLMEQIIKSMFEEERKNKSFEFFTWLNNPKKMLDLPLFGMINTCIEEKGCHSSMAALFCDVIQKPYFERYNLTELTPYFHYAIEALNAKSVEGLRTITAIAFLKEFVHKFWNTLKQDNMLKPVEFNFKGFNVEIIELIDKINESMRLSCSLIYSLKIYFLRDLRNREYSMGDVNKFCQAQSSTLPWLKTLRWDNNQGSRLQFNIYYSFKDYIDVESCFKILFYDFNNVERFNKFFKKVTNKEETSARISLMGGILNRLHVIRATRKWNHDEIQATKFLNDEIMKINSLSNIYKIIIEKLITNKNSIMQLDMNISNSDLLIKSVIGHVIALHSSIPAESSPLAYLLHNLSDCSGLYILACSSDIQSVILSAVLKQNGKFTRYRCKCGFIYLIGDCGQANGRGTCPECHNSIGGERHVSCSGNERLDASPITKAMNAKDEKGYIGEEINRDINHSLRSLSPISYRILHLFVHSIIGAWAPSSIATKFLHKNANDSVEYCMGHIRNDWGILLNLLDCSEENLALSLHAILDRMFLIPPRNTILKTPKQREEWETNFTRDYVFLFKKISNAAAEFRAKITQQENSSVIEEEINQTIPMDESFILERLPRLWRFIGTTSFQGLRAYYNSDLEKHESCFPFISVFFRYYDKLEKVKHLWPIVNFVQMTSSRLEYRVSREKAREQTFEQFINEESNGGESVERCFNEFANAWNSVIDDVDQFQCHELQKPKPIINLTSPIVLALAEPRDSGVYLCAILEYLVGLQNNFLQEVLTIPIGSTRALKFLEEPYSIPENTVSSSSSRTHGSNSTDSPTRYHLQSLRIDQTKQINFISYKWDDNILQSSYRNLEVGRGQDIIYDLQKIEMELARGLVYEKVHISTLNDSQAYMEPFPYHMELFQGYMRILGDIKSSILQQKIPSDKIPLIMDVIPTSSSHAEYMYHNIYSLSFNNASELLTSLEILLCFVKRTSIGSEETTIRDYVNQWMKLSELLKYKSFNNLLNTGLCLKHLIDLYELIEEQVANSVVKYIDDKFKIDLSVEMKDEIDSAVEFERTSMSKERIPAEVFALALKRFMLRFLKDFSNDQLPLSYYINDKGLNLWPAEISDELLEKFPESLLICHIYTAYEYVCSKNSIKRF